MSFEKKLVILTGKTGRGTALLERNGMGTFVTLNAFALPDLTAGEYALGVKTGTDVFRREIGSLGRIKSRFALPDGEYAAAHLVVFRTFDEEVVLYGTSSGRKMWEGNLMDGLRRNKVEAKTTDTGTNVAPTQEFHYSERKIEDYFLRIDPSSRYYDGALAEVNYFDYTPQEPTADTDVLYYDIPPTPGEMERMYLRNRFGGGVAVSQPQANEEIASSVAAVVADAQPQARGERKEKQDAQKTADEPIRIKSASEYSVEQAVAAVKTEAGFYASVKAQLDKLFADGERFAPLERALPGTKWVRVNYDDSGRYYVVGLIGNVPEYIAYGVPGVYGETPAAFEGADFVPLDSQNPAGEGFWVLFQSAETGKEIAKNP
ncbi:MAG: hypothetical protein HFE47_06350 [Clostridia bacterium]|nr:hypothetical protein [Clostridia bacterium]